MNIALKRGPREVILGHNFISGRPAQAASGAVFESTDPSTGAVVARFPRSGAEEIEAAVQAAKRAQPAWAALDPNDKARILWTVGEKILAAQEELALLEALDVGKPIANARTIDIPRTADTFFYFSGWATKVHGETIPVRGPFLNYTVREPLGVVGAIIPWNFPLLLAARKLAPALATGNAVVLKPPEEASLSCLKLVELCAEAGVPDGVVNLVTGLGEEAGAALVRHPEVAKIAFTGGTDTGRIVMREAAGTLKRLQLELGGKSPLVLFADAHLEAAAKAAVTAAFYNQGELCTAASRLLVERKVHDEVLGLVEEATRALVTGDALEPLTQVGPLISQSHLQRVAGYVSQGTSDGARLVMGGATSGPGYFHEPTVFTGVDPAMRIAREEIFGPVLSVLTFDGVEQAAQIANATDFGLAAGIFTRDIGKAHALAGRLRAGTVWINTYNRFDAASPYGGVGASGFGRENGRAVLDELTQTKSVWVSLG